MIVTGDVRNLDNMLLIAAGCALSERHINILCAWGIAEIQVEACEAAEDARDLLQELPPARLEQLTRELASTFWEPVDKGPVQQEVFNLVLRRQAKRALAN